MMTLVDKDLSHILHVVASIKRRGIELWLIHILRHIDRDRA